MAIETGLSSLNFRALALICRRRSSLPRPIQCQSARRRRLRKAGTNHEQRRFNGMSTNEKTTDLPSNAVKDPDDWSTGDETMTGAQAS